MDEKVNFALINFEAWDELEWGMSNVCLWHPDACGLLESKGNREMFAWALVVK